jgi:hypothetical protein
VVGSEQIGVCIKEWAEIENLLFQLCVAVLKAETRHVSIIFYRTPTG